jgi:hypothetical protein
MVKKTAFSAKHSSTASRFLRSALAKYFPYSGVSVFVCLAPLSKHTMLPWLDCIQRLSIEQEFERKTEQLSAGRIMWHQTKQRALAQDAQITGLTW